MTRVKPRHPGIRKTLASVILQGFCGGDSWTRTNDPIDVNDVLYRLSHATLSEHSGLYLTDRSEICSIFPVSCVNDSPALRSHLHRSVWGS